MDTEPISTSQFCHDNHKFLFDKKRETEYNIYEDSSVKLLELLAKITPDNCHPEISFGSAVGEEIEW